MIFLLCIFAAALLACAGLVLVNRKRREKEDGPVVKRRPWWHRDGRIVLVDANNVRGALGFDVDLLDLCAACCRVGGEMILCVDHGPESCAFDSGDGVVVSFAGKKQFATADDTVVCAVGRLAKLGGKVTVVTADRELSRRCKFACMRFPQSSLKIIRSLDFADWLHSVDAFRGAGGGPFDVVQDEWVTQPRLVKISARRPKNASEGTPSRVEQARGLHARMTARTPSGQKSQSPLLQDFIDRHPLHKKRK